MKPATPSDSTYAPKCRNGAAERAFGGASDASGGNAFGDAAGNASVDAADGAFADALAHAGVLAHAATFDDAPIGIFDSGYGGLTVAREIAMRLPQENLVFVGDSARCPYGPRDLAEVDSFVQQICAYLVGRGCKLIVIACNTATAAGLAHAQRTFDVPIVGVVEPGARAAACITRNRKVGVIATKGTVKSNAYSEAIRHIDAGITVFSTATPRFVEIAELGIKMAEGPFESYMSEASKVYIRPEFEEIAREYLEPLRRCGIDTLVLGCTHYPLLKALIGGVVGREVTLVSSAEETAADVERMLGRRGAFAHEGNVAVREFLTSGTNVDEFACFGERVLSMPMKNVGRVVFG